MPDIPDEVLAQAEALLREKFKGYHFEVYFYPIGGSISVEGCEECGTLPGVTLGRWKFDPRTGESLPGVPSTFLDAVEDTLARLRAEREGK